MADGTPVPMEASASVVELLNRSEIDTQIATAQRYPRSIALFIKESKSLVSLSAEVAGECSYALPRGGKTITGPSARFAEIIASCWGNSRAGARVVGEDQRFVTAQGVFHDLQRNLAITYETQRRITDKHGKTYQDDMIGVTANAACSIALRNAILKGIPKAFWNEIYKAAVATAKGDVKTLPQRREAALEAARQIGFSDHDLFKLLSVRGKADIDLDKLFELSGILTAINEGDTTKTELLKEISPATENGASPKPPKMTNGDEKTDTAPPAKTRGRSKPKNEKPSPPPPPPPPPAQQDAFPPEDDEPPRSPDDVLIELENVVSGIESEDDLKAVAEEYYADPALAFPGDMSRAKQIIAEAQERITG